MLFLMKQFFTLIPLTKTFQKTFQVPLLFLPVLQPQPLQVKFSLPLCIGDIGSNNLESSNSSSLTPLLHENCVAPCSNDCSTSLNNLDNAHFNSNRLLTLPDNYEEQNGNFPTDSNDEVSDTLVDPLQSQVKVWIS